MPASPWIKDVTSQTFEADVLKKSAELPVVVDFWAPWCGPCKQLGPLLEKLTNEYGGKFLLVKIDVEAEQEIAAAFQIQSIPVVVAFRDGQGVNDFVGVLPESELRDWLATLWPSPVQTAMMEGMKLEETHPASAEMKFREASNLEPTADVIKIALARHIKAQNRDFELLNQPTSFLNGEPRYLEPEAQAIKDELEVRDPVEEVVVTEDIPNNPETTKLTLLTKYKQDFNDYLKKLEEEPRKLVESGKEFKGLMESLEILTKLTEIHEQLSVYFKIVFNNQDILRHFGSDKIRQIGHEVIPTRECLDDNSIDDDDKAAYVLRELKKLGYKKKHWYFKEVFLLEILYMIDILTIVIEPEYIPLEEREAEDEPERQDRYISAEVKMNVWRRDNGKCSSCGSKEKLEYDHIIPVSKGGSNTERNVQLLCEKCNREKAAKIA